MPFSPPPRNESGVVTPHDHLGIASEDKIIRRISPHYIADDEKAKSGRRISSAAYQPSTTGNKSMSVDVERSIVEAGLNPQDYVTCPPYIGSVWFTSSYLRSEGLLVGFDPLPENPHHGGVWGTKPAGVRKKLLDAAQWYVMIEGVDLRPE